MLASGTGCRRKEKQFTAEAQTARSIMLLLEWHELEKPGVRATNLAHVFADINKLYPYDWHQRFKRFGKYAGFQNSIFEKYVFLPPGKTNRYVDGEIIAVNAQPYPSPDGPERIIISRVGPGPKQYRYYSYKEERIPGIIGDIPKPQPMPAPPPAPPEIREHAPILDRISGYFFGFTQANGIDHRVAVVLWYGLLSLPAILVIGLGCWLWRRALRHQRL